MRVLKIGHPDSGVNHPTYVNKISFKTWITDTIRDELLGWSAQNTHRPHSHDRNAHTWHFENRLDREAFVSHRPMAYSGESLPLYFMDRAPRFPFDLHTVVSVDVRRDGVLCPEDRRIDWFWDDVEQWVLENAVGGVGRAFLRDHAAQISMWVVHYGFERQDDADLFRARWNLSEP